MASHGVKVLVAFALFFALASGSFAAEPQTGAPKIPHEGAPLLFSTDSVGPVRFIAVHGRDSAIMGYPSQGLEVWAWPFQILNRYRVGIRLDGESSETRGELLLRRVEYRPNEITRIYVGRDFTIREKLFVPLNLPGAIFSYEIEGRDRVEIGIHFTPVLNLMWPAAAGGQSVHWENALSGYRISIPQPAYSALITSPNIISHDSTENATLRNTSELSFVICPQHSAGGKRLARVFIGLDQAADAGGLVAGSLVSRLSNEEALLERQSVAHYSELEENALQVETPDEEVNRALLWSQVALDQAWVCNPQLGCGLVGGYGPSRNGRRPQYAWFFAGDGLIGVDGLTAAGNYARARAELEFILKYRNKTNGMIWHELSQSAAFLDWAGKYPYMFVHVDITFQFLGAVARYVAASGDLDFAKEHWSALNSAYLYCRSLIDPSTNLPRIPQSKEGSNEQERESDELSLSAAWLNASAAFAQLAGWTAHASLASEATQANELAKRSIAARYWDSSHQFWIDGHTVSGKEILDERSRPADLLAERAFPPEENNLLLDKIASSNFQTDWGIRGVSAASPSFDPGSYAQGSVSALGTANVAEAFWAEHRPVTAFGIWSSILPWLWLDSLGHIHEVLVGDSYHQQIESVPEQTWSSAGLLFSAVHGLLGIETDSIGNKFLFAPHLPFGWHRLTVRNIHQRDSVLGIDLNVENRDRTMTVSLKGKPLDFIWDPEIPLGARVLAAECGGHSIAVATEFHAQDEHARVQWRAPQGFSNCRIQIQGGVNILPSQVIPLLGNASMGMRIISVTLRDTALTVDADLNLAGPKSFLVETEWTPTSAEGASIVKAGVDMYRVDVATNGAKPDTLGYFPRRVILHFAREETQRTSSLVAPKNSEKSASAAAP